MAEEAAEEIIALEVRDDWEATTPQTDQNGTTGNSLSAETKEQPYVHIIPDGGWRAWATVAGSFLMSMCTFGYINAYGVYQAYYVQTLLPSYSPSAISWIGSLQTCLLFLCGLVTGRLFDAGNFRPMMIGGGVLVVGCIFALSAVQVDGYYQVFLSQAVGQGLGLGIVYLPSLAVLGQHFQKRRSTAMGISVAGSSLGGIVFPILLNNVFQSRGFQWGVRAMGFFQLGTMIIANLLMSTHYHPHQKAMKPPSPLKLLRDVPYLVAMVAAWTIGLGLYFVFFYIQLYAETVGISSTVAFYTLAMINAASIFGRTLPNLLADKFGPITVLIPCSVVTGAIVFAVLGIKNVGGLVIVCILYGFWSGAYVSLVGPMYASMADSLSEIGLRMGLAFAFLGFSALIGTPIDGALLGDGPDYTWWKAILFSGVTMLSGCALLVVAWVLFRKKVNKQWV
ncbi:MFS general substrate transporter [Dacryopinax primogenitus]|uniref:MFS general substrate transporter n=1 Tax=Dacryopinax primogenitus (strain DJM 731) TaxID=1858805 RepID=M5FX78_DACPD|nr:MFS general substrate transporter [Dacryopinax primogenitus]EJU01044.1 MFS general substrate transporter [Dacryopinax primogenitus]